MDDPHDVLDDHADELDEEVLRLAHGAIDAWDGWRGGVSYKSAAAAAVYAAGLYAGPARRMPQGRVAEIFDVSEITIRNYWSECMRALQ